MLHVLPFYHFDLRTYIRYSSFSLSTANWAQTLLQSSTSRGLEIQKMEDCWKDTELTVIIINLNNPLNAMGDVFEKYTITIQDRKGAEVPPKKENEQGSSS